MADDSQAADPNFMLSLARGLGVLRAFEGQSSLSITEAARLSGLNRPSAGRCLHTLTCLGYVRERDGRYSLTPKLLPLAAGFLTSTPLASASQAVANALRDSLQETVSVGALDPSDPGRIIYIARAERNQVIAAPLMVGSTLPSHCTSMGRVLLASLAPCETERWLARAALEPRTERTIVSPDALRAELVAVGERRWSLVEEELEVGLRSLAVPVRDREGQVLAALNVATFSDAHSREDLIERYLPDLRAAAGQLERAIQSHRPNP
ncbi:IclR family transcriptional regulator [Sphingobium indicum IP26]|uniref:IclR family transcriptional regulator n=1 Tax=Sphingobium indicum F2 TaxID=1450518 RepID=A0A8E0WNC7_9SPHN|nr:MULTISPECIES: IclR family transcriptional regulator C-terminal domain-containing protein [Sphingobium]EPR12451.1 IclR family transcriptional regulator [Sphingobium indicum IP26]EQB08472.1 IclR family transcriptional regulator [Sphingobium sp. HDIP04]KER34428.1 IclR family transcriptional regulator [Sphingobium indicum F2]